MKVAAETIWANAGLKPSEDAIRDHLLFGLLQEGGPIPPDHPAQLETAGIRFPGGWFGLIGLQVTATDAWSLITGLGHTAYSEAHLAVNLLERFRQELQGNPYVQPFKAQNDLLCIVCGETLQDTQQRLAATAAALQSLEKRIAGIRLFANCSAAREHIESLGTAHVEVRQLAEYRVLQLELSPLLRPEVLRAKHDFYAERPDILKEQAILSAYRAGNYREASELFDSLWDTEYLLLANPLILLRAKCFQYLDSLLKTTDEMLEGIPEERLAILQPDRRLLAAASYPELRAQMEHIFGFLNDLVIAGRKNTGAVWISQVKDYIRDNYADPNLNVNRVADEFGKNPSYLSRSFLRSTGTSVLDYIHRYRVQEAKILIGRGETLASAAAAVGYSNVLTMSRAFKKLEGTTPGKLKN